MITFPADPSRAAGAAVPEHTRVSAGEGASCGQFLRRAREQRGLTLEQIAERTKLPLRHLAALERDEFAVLPAGMYRRAEVRAYADAIGLDRTSALAAFAGSFEEAAARSGAGVHGSVPHPPTRRARVRVWTAAALAFAAGVIALAMWAGQPRARDLASVAAPAAREAAGAASAPTRGVAVAADHGDRDDAVLAATSARTLEVASAGRGRTTEYGPPASDTQALDNRPARIAAAAGVAEPQLVVTTEPAGASVTVNGIRWGITPIAIRYLPPGPKRVRVTLDGYGAEEQVIQVAAGPRTTTLRIPLRSRADERDAASTLLPANAERGN
jgi:cytoskeleton protein RodZ